jgi:multidrug efflux system membrane fusion protein
MEQLRNGAKLTVDVFDRAAQKKLATGELIAVDNQIDTTTGTVKVRASFPNDDFALFPNQFVNTRLLVKTLQDVTLVPSSTIQQNGQTSFVYVIQDNVAYLKNIKPGVSDNGLTQVEGINPGDVLADSSFDKLQDNTKISVATGKPAATKTPGGQQKHGSQQKQGSQKQGSDQQQSGSKGS